MISRSIEDTGRVLRWRAVLMSAIQGCTLVALLVTSSCMSDGGGKSSGAGYSESLRNALGQQHFRGRWWSFYERSRILQEFEHWEDAESDLRVALSLRNSDQWRARTYGLHFASEYFPNRELGAVLFAQNRYEDALLYLENSLDQQFTARGAYYLNKAREGFVRQSDSDARPPTFRLISPTTDRAIANINATIIGVAEDDTFVTSIAINGEPVPIRVSGRSVTISHDIRLTPGRNRVAVRITDIVGRVTEVDLFLSADHDGPAVSFDGPVDASGRVAGLVRDPSGIQSLEIGGLPVRLDAAQGDAFRFQVSVDRNLDRAGLRFECVDALGNTTSGVVPNEVIGDVAGHERVRIASASMATRILPAQSESPIRVTFANLREGQRYLSDQIAVSIAIDAQLPVSKIELDGQAINGLVAGRRLQRITRRIPLESVGLREIVVTATDVEGNTGSARVEIERRLPQIDELSARLKMALLGNLWSSHRAEFEGYVDFITDELPLVLSTRGRFQILQRDEIDLVLDEQMLIEAMGSSDALSRFGNLELTDFVLIGDLRPYGTNLEILVHAIDSLTLRETIVDVYGPASNLDELRELVENLALRLEQEFPRVQGEVIRIRSGSVITNLNALDRVRRAMRCIVFRREEVFDPVTGESLGTDLIPMAEGSLREVRKNNSVVKILHDLVDPDGVSPDMLRYVLTK